MDKTQKNKKGNKKTFIRWEEPYNRPVDIAFDLVFCMVGCFFLLGFGPFEITIRLIIAAIVTAIFFFLPNMAIFVFAFLFFLCTAHINGAIAVVISVALLLLIGSNHRQACLIILSPMAFLAETLLKEEPDSTILMILDSMPIAIWILFIVMASKYRDFIPACFYSIYFGFMAIMTNSFGASIYGYAKVRDWITADFSDFNGFVESIFITKPEVWLMDYSFYGTISFVFLTMCTGAALYKVYVMKKHFEEFQKGWTFDGIKYILFISVLSLYFMVLQIVMGLNTPAYLYTIIIGVAIAFVISRGFVVDCVKVNKTDEQIHEMITTRMSTEDEAKYLKEINVETSEQEDIKN